MPLKILSQNKSVLINLKIKSNPNFLSLNFQIKIRKKSFKIMQIAFQFRKFYRCRKIRFRHSTCSFRSIAGTEFLWFRIFLFLENENFILSPSFYELMPSFLTVAENLCCFKVDLKIGNWGIGIWLIDLWREIQNIYENSSKFSEGFGKDFGNPSKPNPPSTIQKYEKSIKKLNSKIVFFMEFSINGSERKMW